MESLNRYTDNVIRFQWTVLNAEPVLLAVVIAGQGGQQVCPPDVCRNFHRSNYLLKLFRNMIVRLNHSGQAG